MSRREKQRAQLSTIEAELRLRLVDALKRVAAGEDTLFFTTVEFNPSSLPAHMLSKNSAELSELALESLRLHDILGETPTGSVGEMFRGALREAARTADHNRFGPVRLAARLLDELGGFESAPSDSKIILRLEPAAGWVGFPASEALLDCVGEHLSSWRYLNFTSDTSTWENPDDGCLVSIAFGSTARVSELMVIAPDASALSSQSASDLLEHLREAYGVVVRP